MKRNTIPVNHNIKTVGQIGRLQTLSVYPVIGGDSFELDYSMLWRLAPLRNALSLPPVVDVAAYYIPHRHVYDNDASENWINFMKDGQDESVTLDTITTPATQHLNCLGEYMPNNTTYPAWRIVPYHMIWNRFYRHPKLTTVLIPETYKVGEAGYPTGHSAANSPLNGGEDQAKFGYMCARLKKSWSTGIVSGLTAADKTINIPVAGTADLDILDIEKTKARYSTEVEREYFSVRYNDLMAEEYGSGSLNIDADQRPEMLTRHTFVIDGYDIDGTGDANVGDYSGKGYANGNFRIPRYFCKEHGSIWVVAVVRFPTAGLKEINPLSKKSQPTFDEISGNYELAMTKEPEAYQVQDFFAGTDATSIGTLPWGEWYRMQPDNIHNIYQNLQGYPYIKQGTITSHTKAVYGIPGEYDDVFQSLQEEHWQVQAFCNVNKYSRFPLRRDSIFAGLPKKQNWLD